MKVILQKDVSNLGDAGDIREVADGYARNFLLPKKLVIAYSEANGRTIAHQKHLIKVKKEKRKKESEKVADQLKTVSLSFQTKAGEDGKLFGSITSADISAKLAEAGITVDKRKIVLDEQIKHVGEFNISIKLEEGVSAPLKVTVVKE
ncbi:MAG TPA: 50S ribosomal protein L9 [Spirochaetota bacterium]|nr:50S ribosomal protein L9 [Spirochaetota bacterium]HPM34717.1 50S ribosomal protein L9 [Spirochaetota bacterium]